MIRRLVLWSSACLVVLMIIALSILSFFQSVPVFGMWGEQKTASAVAISDLPTPVPCVPNCWTPELNTSWHWQLQGDIDPTIQVEMYDIDGFETSTKLVNTLHQAGRYVTCYLNAGSVEDWRSDAHLFPKEVIGDPVDGWDGENWLDIRRIDILGPLMQARVDMCQEKGFDSIEFDLVNGYANDTGFAISYENQLRYNIHLADMAHKAGMSVALKSNPGQVNDLVGYFDWYLSEECFEYDECDLLLPFIQAKKAVMNVEYNLEAREFCRRSNRLNFNSLELPLDLDGSWRIACR